MANHAISQPNASSLPSIPSQPGAAEAPLQPGFRLVPAKIGRTNAASVIVWVQCPTWCTVDHVDMSVVHVEDITHNSEAANVFVHSILCGGVVLDIGAAIQSDPVATDARLRAAHLVVEDGGNEYAYLTPDMAEEVADGLIGFASQLRHMARVARQANAAAGRKGRRTQAVELRKLAGGAV